MAKRVLTERVERVVVLIKLDFEWRTGTENDKSTSQKLASKHFSSGNLREKIRKDYRAQKKIL